MKFQIPRASVLVRVGVLAAGISVGSVGASAAPPSGVHWAEAAPPWLEASTSEDEAFIYASGIGRGATIEIAEAKARRAAYVSLVGLFGDAATGAGLPVERPTPEVLLQANPGWLGAAARDRMQGEDAGEVVIALRLAVEQPVWRRAVAKNTEPIMLWGTGFGPSLVGPARVIRPPQAGNIQTGDILLEVNGTPVKTAEGLPEFAAQPVQHQHFTLQRGGARFIVDVTESALEPIDSKWMMEAPTCGACCHGQCRDDERGPKPFPW